LSFSNIGLIDCTFNDLQSRIKIGDYKTYDLEDEPSDLCFLPNGYLLFASYQDNNLTLYDKDYNFIKRVKMLNDEAMSPYSVTTNNKNKIYIQTGNSMIMTDLELNYLDIKTEKFFLLIYFIEFHKELLYICDRRGKCIVVMSEDLKLRSRFHFEFEPVQIAILNNMACIVPSFQDLHFYSIIDFSIIHKFEKTSCCSVSVHASKFYCMRDKTVEIYNEDGTLSSSVNSDCFNYSYDTQHEFIRINDGKLHIYCNKKKLIVI
jgi:hypothetical protein